jgi:WD40 repeat protein
MLQRAWNPNPQTLPFAPYIKTHALVSLVQKGLQYHEIEQSLDQAGPELDRRFAISPESQISNRALQDGNPVPLTPSKYFFGPAPLDDEALKPGESRHDKALDRLRPDQAPLSPGSKADRENHNTVNGHLAVERTLATPSTKKSRKSEHPEATVNGDEGAMEIDSNGVAHERVSATPAVKSPSPAEAGVDADGDVGMSTGPPSEDQQDQEQAAAAMCTLTTGRSVGVQITPAKVADLGPHTTVVDVAVPRDDHVIRTVWRPYDSSVFAASGDTFCDLWKLSTPSSHAGSAPVHERLFDSRGDGTWVTALAWDPTGQKLAVATYNEMRGSIAMYNVNGDAVDLLPDVPRMITGLHWSSKGSYMVVVAADGKDTELALWDDSSRPEELPPPQVIEGPVYDFTWAGDNQVYGCGNGSVFQCDVDSSIHDVKKFSSTSADTEWAYIRGTKKAVVTASCKPPCIWVPTHDIYVEDAHRQSITAIELRPQQQDSEFHASTSLILASSSMDDTVKIWHIDLESKRVTCLHRLFSEPAVPPLNISFSPDGYAIGAASVDKLFIWNVERGGEPLATWTAAAPASLKEEGPENAANGENGSSDAALYRSIAWDMDGKKVVMGFGKQVRQLFPFDHSAVSQIGC